MNALTEAQIIEALDRAPHGSDELLDAVQAAQAAGGKLEQRANARCEADARRSAEQDAQDAADLERHWPANWRVSPNEHSQIHYPSARVA